MPGVLSLVELYCTLLLKGCLWSSIVYWIDTLPRGGMYKELPSPRTKRFGMYNISLYTIPCQRGCVYKKLLLEIAGCMVLNKTNTSLLMEIYFTVLQYSECDISSRDFSVSRLFSIFWEYRSRSRKFWSQKKVSVSVSKIFGLKKSLVSDKGRWGFIFIFLSFD